MCGIAGFYNFQFFNKDQSVPILRSMLTRIKHRGPDQSGIYLSPSIGMGSVRLSVVDLVHGTMPISNQNENLWIVFNGEIFNHAELREELESKAYQFQTDTDTEVVVNLYEAYGPDFVHKLNGQFAIAIWDKNKEELFLARDRVGIRPLFYSDIKGSFVFASEMKSMLEFPGFEPSISAKAMADYLTFWTALSPATIFENVFEVPPGSYMVLNKLTRTTTTYWELPIHKPEAYKYTTIKEASEAFETIFSDAVSIRMRADVPVAAYLSGGLDSSVTTSFIRNLSNKPLQTFSIGFTEEDYDESSYQKIASDYFKTEHSSIVCGPADIANDFKQVVWHTEAPLLRTSPAPMAALAKSVADHNIKVVITGEGADELLGGYNIFKETKIRRFWAKDANSKYRPLLLKKLYPYLPQMKNPNSNVLKMFFGYKLMETESPIYSHILRWHNTSRISNYLSQGFRDQLEGYKPVNNLEKKLAEKLKGFDSLTQASWIEINIFMSGYLLSSQGDRMAMAHGIEGRYPFLDHRVIEFCMSLHPDLKLNGLNEKYLLKKLMKDRVPEVILDRSKQAYRAPIRSVFSIDNLPEDIKTMISEPAILKAGIFNPRHVEQLMNKINSKNQVSEIDNMALTAIISTQILYDLFINRSFQELNEDDLVKLDKTIID